MIKKIPKGQLCQAFDMFMTIQEKVTEILQNPSTANTGCVCPAYVYMEGIRGKRFLCDYHYTLEKTIVHQSTPYLWNDICKYLINNIEDVKDTFKKVEGDQLSVVNEACVNDMCGKIAYVKCESKWGGTPEYYCNFHYRKKYYRYLSNGVPLETKYIITDERYRINDSIESQYESLTRL